MLKRRSKVTTIKEIRQWIHHLLKKALAAGKKVDENIAAQRAKNAERMNELQKKFVAKQLEEMKSADEKKDD